MAKIPTVAIIGRPNTGKSTLFNRLIGKRKAIVSEVPGTTRDIVASTVCEKGVNYLLVDTGGISAGPTKVEGDLEKDVVGQALLALSEADVILFTVHGKEELTSSDYTIVNILRKKRKHHVPVILVITQCDNPEECESATTAYLELGFTDDILPVSAIHNLGIDALRKCIATHLKKLHFKKATSYRFGPSSRPSGKLHLPTIALAKVGATNSPRIAIIGKPNVGKSSIVNALMSDAERKRSARIVSPIPGTTRDATDTIVRNKGKQYTFIDTAGLKRKAKVVEGIDRYASLRSIQAISECDVAILILDALEPISNQDKRIANLAMREGKGLIILVNKIDLKERKEHLSLLKYVAHAFSFCRFAPIIPCSAVTREGLLKIFPLIEHVTENRLRRIPTKDLKGWFSDIVSSQPFQALPRSKFITQAKDVPPTFVIFVKDPKAVRESELKYLDTQLRSLFAFEGTPVRWITKSSE